MDFSFKNMSQAEGSSKKSSFEDLTREELISKCKGLLAIAQKAKQVKSDLQNDIESYKIQLDKCETEKKTSQENVKTLQELVDSLTEQKLNYITELDSAHNKIKSLNKRCNTHEDEIEKYKSDLFIKDKQMTDTAQKLSDLDSEIISLKRQNNRLVDENEQLISQLTELEMRTAEFNNIGLQQREQLQKLEEKVHSDKKYELKIEELEEQVKELENKIANNGITSPNQITDYENKIKNMELLYETEKEKNEKMNIKLRSYKDKILKCAACINQLKNSRFILFKTVKEYSENIPKWQNDIIKASKVLDSQMNELNKENLALKEKLDNLENQIKDMLKLHNDVNSFNKDMNNENDLLKTQSRDLQQQINHYTTHSQDLPEQSAKLISEHRQLKDVEFPAQIDENKLLKEKNNELTEMLDNETQNNIELNKLIENMRREKKHLHDTIKSSTINNETITNLNLQIKALESEKSILVKEKLSAKNTINDLENQNKIMTDQINRLTLELQTKKTQLETSAQEKIALEEKYKKDKDEEVNNLKCRVLALQEQYDLLKKEHEDLIDLNGLLKEEVETLKLSLEQPKDDAENLSDLNVSLQADIVKLETKLGAYKQENASLLAEIKESRVKSKEYDSLLAEYEEAKSKLLGYKTENAELLNEMKEINQVLKERGEAISKLQKAIVEMERLIETLEKDRDTLNKEKDDLYKKIGSLEHDLKNAEQKTNVNNELSEQITLERDSAVKSLIEKDALITSLKDEIEKLKLQQSLPSADLPNEDMSTSTISKAEEHSRMKDLDETFEEKYTKLRIFALKLKKKLNETITQLQSAEQDKARLEKLLSEHDNNKLIFQTNNARDEKGDGTYNKDTDNKDITDIEHKMNSLTTAFEVLEKELEKVKGELANKTRQLTSEVDAHRATKNQLEKARRDAKKKNVLSLEMEDYERSMKELTSKMEENKKKMIQMESTIDTQDSTITTMRTQIKLLEEQVKTEETQNRLIKEELQQVIEEGKDKDNVVQVKNNIISKLELDLENEKRKNEESYLEMTSLLSEKEKIVMSLGEDKTELSNKLKKLEFKCVELNEKLKVTNIELEDLKAEYTSYKVRAQAVLRQNQTVDHSQEERLKEELAVLKTQMEKITTKLNIVQEQCDEQSAEAEASRRRATEAAGEVGRAQQRTARLHADLARLAHQLDSERAQHKLQVSTLTQCYKTQISELESKLQKETEELKKQLKVAQDEAKLNKSGSLVDDSNKNQYMLPVIPKEDNSDGEMDINVSMIPREEGEGSEFAPSPPLSKAYLSNAGGNRSPVPLDRLLEEGVPDDDTLDTASLALTPEQETADLRRKLTAQQQRVKHVTVLLAESERECARMSQLSELLKSELRRVRGDTHGAHNTEYMKNVTLKFLTLPPGDERSRLVPVLQKILTLSNEETQKIQAVAKGLDPNPGKGWGSYLPWPGGK